MRDRLIELINNYPCMSTAEDCFIESISSDLADYLFANGVIVPPCKVGTKVYYVDFENNAVFCGQIVSYSLDAARLWVYCRYDVGFNYWYPIEEIGKTVFLTREDAEAALKGGVQE